MLDRDAYDRLVDATDPAAVIVTAAAGDERAGCLVTFDAPCSVTPPLYAIWLSDRNHTHDIACSSGVLTVHLLDATADRQLAELFASVSGHDTDKFARCSWQQHGDAVVLDLATGYFTADITNCLPTGDHTLFVLSPTHVGGRVPLRPMRFSDAQHLPPGRPP